MGSGEAELAGKVAMVTGASAGLGEHLATMLAGAGATLAITARRLDRLEDLAGRIEAAGGRALPLAMDVTDPASILAGVAETVATLGRIDILLNNAGIAVTKPALLCTVEDYDALMDTNLKGAFFAAQAVARTMIERGEGGRIINMSSLLGLKVLPQLSLYAISKAAIAQMTKALALEWIRHGIKVNAICPGYIETEMNRATWESEGGKALIRRFPARRLGAPSDLDGLVLLLASPRSDFMTGSVIPIDEAQSLM